MDLPKGFYIDGKWQEPSIRNKSKIINPASLESLGEVLEAEKEDVELAINSAKNASDSWRSLGGHERAKFLKKIEGLIRSRADKYAEVLVKENGKSFKEAKAEILYGAEYFNVYAGEAQRIKGEIYDIGDGLEVEYTPEPIGVVAAITPWNFPQAMLARKLAAALAAGCCMVAKPDSQTPFSAYLLAKICQDAELPKGVFNVVTGDSAMIGKTLMESQVVKKMSFTGSTRVGKILVEQSTSNLKKLSLELGGNAPFIVFDDADIDKAVDGAIASKYRNSGQTCVCTNRFLIHAKVSESFEKKLSEKLKLMKMGNGLDEETDLGPLINQAAYRKIKELVEDAIDQGAVVNDINLSTQEKGYYLSPQILKSVPKTAEIFNEEIFGPISVIYEFESEEELIALANSTKHGLASYLYTQDMSRLKRLKKALEFGMIGINHGRVSSPWAPFGGVKESGYGKEGAAAGLKEYQVNKMCMQKYE